MAELATGAVNTLLGVIRNEARRLGRVQGDVLFIQEEMESMRSFLVHLARTRREEHDEQVRTWMNQVRILANDCNNCLDIYLYRRNPDFHRPRRGLKRYLWWGWAFWWLREMVARHRAASQLRELKDRARDVGERRLRYGVKVSDGTPRRSSSPGAVADAGAAAGLAEAPPHRHMEAVTEDDEEEEKHEGLEDGDHELVPTTDVGSSASTKVKNYFKNRLLDWIESLKTSETPSKPTLPIPSITFALPNAAEVPEDMIAREALVEAQRHFRSVLVDIPDMHLEDYYHVPLRPKEILFYILRALRDQEPQDQTPALPRNWDIYLDKKDLLREIKEGMLEFVDEEMVAIYKRIGNQMPHDKEIMKDKKKLEKDIENGKLGLDDLLWLLITLTVAVAEQEDQAWKKTAIRTLSRRYDSIIRTAATKLKEVLSNRLKNMKQASSEQQPRQHHQESTGSKQQVELDPEEYERILEEVFPRTATSPGTGSSSSVEAEIKEMIYTVKDMIRELQEYNKSAQNNQETGGQTQIQKPAFQEAARKKIGEIKLKIREQLKIKKIMDEIQSNLQADRILIILKTDQKYGWEATRKTLSLLGSSGCFAGAAILMTTTRRSTRQAEEHLQYPQPELIELSVVGCYLDIVRQHMSKHMHQDNLEIVRNILEDCEPHEFCMNIFAQAIKANPKKSTEELHKLHSILQNMPKRLPSSIARKVLKFSYSDLPKQYKSCLLYLAIFPPASEYTIKRTTLVGRWVAEGLITTEDWSWFSSVTEAENCFDVLVNRQFVHPVEIGATGRVKSCTVYPFVHRFITKIAKKQHIVEARLSLHLARHFSIFNDVRLRGSDKIETFLKKNMHDLPQFSKLKVLDLEGCHCFANKGYLKDICSKILMLKYLSLRDTDVNQLPREINNLHELEVLDIRQTKIHASATRHVLLLKLKRLLAGHIIRTGPGTAKDVFVEIPGLVEKMIDMEVLSNVKPRIRRDLRDIGSLYQLRKLGVAINKDSLLQSLLDAISDLHDCLRSLSITLPIQNRAPSGTELKLKSHPKSLESLNIRGSTQKEQLLPLLVREDSKLTKVTLSRTLLSPDDLKVLANLQNLVCVRLQHAAYTHSELTFEHEFVKLKVLIVDHSGITKINFNGKCPELEKIIWSLNENLCVRHPLSGIEKLRGLKELELISDIAPEVDEEFQKYMNEKKIIYKHKKRENQDQAQGNNAREEKHGVAMCPSIWKVKGWCRRN
ncbi:hypothetical protein SETIT_8G044100v2 [Setaria italica]|uniref:Uncharacterized protein n=1 Tax=Setaria italica TaxID=4555 RepID=A0A368S4E3_SETIT|nr:disease resistance protein RPP13 [Setaria italica]RCV37203.1 hypothetical protein SETIT_8G044100v2 [Setaria italica]